MASTSRVLHITWHCKLSHWLSWGQAPPEEPHSDDCPFLFNFQTAANRRPKQFRIGIPPKAIPSGDPTMANRSIVTAEALPSFLLPRLSWQAARRPFATSIPNTISGHNRDQKQWHRPSSGAAAPFSTNNFRGASYSQRAQGSIASRAAFHTTSRRQRDHHFDTLRFVQRLQSEGFTEEQSVAMMKVLNDVIEERYDKCFSLLSA